MPMMMMISLSNTQTQTQPQQTTQTQSNNNEDDWGTNTARDPTSHAATQSECGAAKHQYNHDDFAFVGGWDAPQQTQQFEFETYFVNYFDILCLIYVIATTNTTE